MKTSFTLKVLFLSCVIVSSFYASQKELADYRANTIYLQNLEAMDSKAKRIHSAIRSLQKSDMDRIQIINRGGARDLRVYGKPIIVSTFGDCTVDFILWSNSLPHQQIECFISAFEYVRHKKQE